MLLATADAVDLPASASLSFLEEPGTTEAKKIWRRHERCSLSRCAKSSCCWLECPLVPLVLGRPGWPIRSLSVAGCLHVTWYNSRFRCKPLCNQRWRESSEHSTRASDISARQLSHWFSLSHLDPTYCSVKSLLHLWLTSDCHPSPASSD